jgi:acyl dehydratase
MTDSVDLSAVPAAVHGQTFEQWTPGALFRTSRRTITESDLISFVTLAGLAEPLFLDANGAKDQGYAGRVVPATLTFAYAEGLVIQTGRLHETGMAFLGTTFEVKGPLYLGETITVVVEVLQSRPTKAGDRGVVTTRNTVVKDDGSAVLVYEPKRMVRGPSVE